MATVPVRLAIIGCGHFGRYHAEAFAKIPGVRLVGFCNRTLDKAEALSRDFGGEITTTNPEELFASNEIDGVIVATQHDSHADLCRRAALAGKHVLIEKPLGMNLNECERLIEAVRGREHLISVGYKFRFFPTVQRARELLSSPNLIVGQLVDERWHAAMWQQDARLGGGSVLGNGCHTLDMICYLAQSRPVRVYAEGASIAHAGHACLDQMNAVIVFENAAMGVWIESQTATPARAGKYQFSIFGLDGIAIELYDRLQSGTFRIKTRTEKIKRSGDEAIYYQAKAFIAQIADGARPACSLMEGYLVNFLLNACFRAHQLKQAQEIAWNGDTPTIR